MMFRLCLPLLGLMASVISVVHLVLLMMRDFRCWGTALRLCLLSRCMKITPAWVTSFWPRRDAIALASGVSLGVASSRVTMTTDMSLSGWGGDLVGQSCEWHLGAGSGLNKHVRTLGCLSCT